MFEKAKWITRIDRKDWGHPPVQTPPPAPYIIRDFEIKADVKSVILSVCGLGQAAYYLNGERIPDSMHPTQQAQYERSVVYNEFDLTSIVREGKNRFGALIGHILLADPENQYRMNLPRMIAQIDIEYKSGEKEAIVSDSSFLTEESPVLFSMRRCGEIWDAKKVIADWSKPETPVDAWTPAAICAGPGGALRKKVCPPERVKAIIKGKEIAPGLYDFGENISGWLRLVLKEEHTEDITTFYSEWITDDGLHASNEGMSKTAFMYHRDRYTPRGEVGEVFEPYFSYHGFRYIEIWGAKSCEVYAIKCHTDMPVISEFKCNNEILNEIHKYCERSILANTHGAMLDCPQREQNEWTGDGMLSSEVISMEFDSYDMYYEWMLNFKDAQHPSGFLPSIVPCRGNWPYSFANGLDWSSAIIHIPYYAYKYSGNPEIAELMWDNMTRAMDYFASRSENNLMDFGVGDWVSVQAKCPIEITDTIYYRIDALMMAEMAKSLGKDDSRWLALAEDIKRDFRAKYITDGALNNRHFTCLIGSVYSGMLEENEIQSHVDAAANEARKENENALRCGIHGLRMVFDVFGKYGYNELLFDILTNTEKMGYAKMVADGITTLAERFDYRTKENQNGHYSSLNHQFMSMVDGWFFRYVAGIKLNGFGWNDIVIEPCLVSKITDFKASVRDLSVSLSDSVLKISSPYPFTLILKGKTEKFGAGSYELKV